jgi:hypothetical protein
MTDCFVRGATVHVGGTFLNKDGNIANPPSAKLYVSYIENGARTEAAPIDLTINSGAWSASWDSSVADPGTVYWCVRADGLDKAAGQGEFTLTANPANPAPPPAP